MNTARRNRRRAAPSLLCLVTMALGAGSLGGCTTPTTAWQATPLSPGAAPTSSPAPLASGAAPATAPGGAYDPSGEPIVRAVRAAAPAVVSIDTAATQRVLIPEDRLDLILGQGRVVERQVPTGAGSGVLLEGGYVLTNQHVVGAAAERGGKIQVTLADGRRFSARAVGTDYPTDIAVLKVDTRESLPQIPLGTNDALVPGQTVIAIGNPVGLSASVSAGVVSALGRPLSLEGRVYENLIQTDTAINPGNSGGALIDLAGNLVGINTLVRADAQNIGFAIPVKTALRIAELLKANGRVVRPTPGLMVVDLDPLLARQAGIPADTSGVMVWLLYRGGPAAEAGLRRGDVITKINGQAITNEADYRKTLEGFKVGQEVTLTVVRGDRSATTKVKLIEAR